MPLVAGTGAVMLATAVLDGLILDFIYSSLKWSSESVFKNLNTSSVFTIHFLDSVTASDFIVVPSDRHISLTSPKYERSSAGIFLLKLYVFPLKSRKPCISSPSLCVASGGLICKVFFFISNFNYLRLLVGETGIEPVTSSL